MTDTAVHQRIQEALADRYRIIRELGGGGMSRVFLADEIALGRQVVLKVLPPDLAQILSGDRFTREVQVAARLQHPHIVPVLTAGVADGLLYYAMPMVEGESLRVRLGREGALPVDEAIRLLGEIADALAAAHQMGVVHRDIKPDNILISHGHAVVTDFGIAKAVSNAGDTDITSTGVVLGTPSYMAPEQASADSKLDHRADLYSLGVVAYEMLAGEPPFLGPTAQVLIAAHVSRPPRPIHDVRPLVPGPLAALVMRLLEKQPADRIQSAQDVVAAVSRMHHTDATPLPTAARLWSLTSVMVIYAFAAAALIMLSWLVRTVAGLPEWFFPALVVLLLIGIPLVLFTAVAHNRRLRATAAPAGFDRLFTWRRVLTGGAAAIGGLALGTAVYLGLRATGIGPVGTLIAKGRFEMRDQVLIADFANQTGDSSLSDVVTQAIRIDLSQSRSIAVVSTDYVRQLLRLMARPPSAPFDAELAREVAQRGGIKAVLSGEVQRAAGGFMVSAQLVNAAGGEILVAHRAQARDSTRILEAVDVVSKRLRERIGESLRSLAESPPLELVTTASFDALLKYSQGVRADDRGDGQQAVRLLEEAVALDTSFAMAWRKLGTVLGNERMDRNRQVSAITRAHALRDRLTERERRLTEATWHSMIRGRQDSAVLALERLLDAWPNDSWALNNIGVFNGWKGRYGEAAPFYRRAIAAEPLSGIAWTNLISSLLSLGHFDSARAVADSFRRVLPEHPDVSRLEQWFRLAAKDFEGAEVVTRAHLEEEARNPRGRLRELHLLAGILQHRGKLREAELALAEAEAVAGELGARDMQVEQMTKRVFLRAWYGGDPERAAQLLAQGERRLELPGTSGPLQHAHLARAAARAGAHDRASRYLIEARRMIRDAPSIQLRMLLAWAQGELAEATRRDVAEAIDSLRAVRESPCPSCADANLAGLFDLLAQRDSALTLYRSFADATQAGWHYGVYRIDLPHVYHRLGELYEWKGDRAQAREFYQRFVDLWKDADPELQPRVQRARQRIVELSGEPQLD